MNDCCKILMNYFCKDTQEESFGLLENTMMSDDLDITLSHIPYNKPICSDDFMEENNIIAPPSSPILKPIPSQNFLELLLSDSYSPSSSAPFEELRLDMDTIFQEQNKNINQSDNESVYDERDVYVDERYITTSPQNYIVYKKPPLSSPSTRQIWKQAGLGNEACLFQIELHLVDWANKYAILTTKEYNITQIDWKCGKTATKYSTTWNIFLKWIICGCISNNPQ